MVNEEKKKFVQKLIQDIQQAAIIGIVNMQNLPAPQLQNMRAMLLKKEVNIIMARKKLLTLGLNNSKKENIAQLVEKIKGMPAVILSSTNPFTLYALIQKNKSEAPAKAGQVAPKDVLVKAGPTNFAPGPIISELASVGIKTKVEGGKLAIINDTVVVKEGDEISGKVAETLKRLDIKPMEIGLDLVAVWEKGSIFDAKTLHIDEDEYRQNIINAVTWARNLAVEAAITTPDTIELLLQKAFRESKALASENDILTDLTAGDVLGKVERQALSLKDTAGVEVGPAKVTEKKEEVKEEPVEEKKEEAKEKEEEKPAEPAPIPPLPEEVKEEEEEPEPTPEPVEEEKPVEDKPKEEPIEEKQEESPAEEEKKEEEPEEPTETIPQPTTPEPVDEKKEEEKEEEKAEPEEEKKKEEEPAEEEEKVEEEKEEPKEEEKAAEPEPAPEPEPEPIPEPPAPKPTPEPEPEPELSPEPPAPEPTPEPEAAPESSPKAEDIVKAMQEKFGDQDVKERVVVEEPAVPTSPPPVPEPVKEKPQQAPEIVTPVIIEDKKETVKEERVSVGGMKEIKPEPVKEKPKKYVPPILRTEEPKSEIKRQTSETQVPTAAELQKLQSAMDSAQQEPGKKHHPKQGNVSTTDAEDLLAQLQKKGTLREEEED